jgi:ABC-type glycerol-3-phosphate transport system substrate-binding protein
MLTLLVGALATGVVGCGDTTDGSPTTATSPSTQSLYNPCTGIPDDALRAAGVDPATEEAGIAGVPQSGWEICGWDGPQYFITVFSTSRTVSEFERKPGNIEFQDVTVGGRQGRQFRVAGASKNLACDVLFPASQGVLQLRILNRAGVDGLDDPCAVLYRVGGSIVPAFPR